jgi:hypothetical protein
VGELREAIARFDGLGEAHDDQALAHVGDSLGERASGWASNGVS